MTVEKPAECPLSVGDKVPDFEVPIYDPVKDDFGTFKLSDNQGKNRWTCLFFYPADFTFV
jgi:peroxiredoxin (alkyl hydroperoxide reductase subunit C)